MESATKVTTTIMLPPDLRERLDNVAADLDRSRSWVCGKAIKEYLARQDSTDPSKGAAP